MATNTAFTCITCRIVFPTSERQRNHCRTDWHKYNLKRKIVHLAPVNAEQFAQKVIAQQVQNREAEERQGLIYECATCRKSYLSENAYHNHMQSKKHREMQVKSEILGMHRHQPAKRLSPLFSDQSDQSDLEDEPIIAKFDPLALCLFCLFPSNDFHGNIAHMTTVHGFFLPDPEYLSNAKGLVAYLADKIEHDHLCLFCNGRGKEWKSPQAARAHMLDKGHCKMAYDDSEDPEDLLNYYDFDPLQDLTAPIPTEDGLVLENGARLGHRQNVRFFRQRLRKHPEEASPEKRLEEAENYAREQGLTRKEKRHLLAITDGRRVSHEPRSMEGLREAMIKQDYRHQIAVKHNIVNTLRRRNQVPI